MLTRLQRVCVCVSARVCGLYTALVTARTVLASARNTGSDYIVDGTPSPECTCTGMYTRSNTLVHVDRCPVHYLCIIYGYIEVVLVLFTIRIGTNASSPVRIVNERHGARARSPARRARMARRLLDIKCGSGASRLARSGTAERTRDCHSADRLEHKHRATVRTRVSADQLRVQMTMGANIRYLHEVNVCRYKPTRNVCPRTSRSLRPGPHSNAAAN